MVRRLAWLWVVLIVLGSSFGSAMAADTDSGWVYRPFSRNFDLLIADPRQPTVSASYFSNPDRDNMSFEASLGGFIAPLRYVDAGRGWTWQADIEAGFFALFDAGSGVSLSNRSHEYDVSFNLSWSNGPWQVQTRLGHLSSHPGDYHLDYENPQAETVSWEYLTGRVSWRPTYWFRIYGGYQATLSHSDEGVGDGMAQCGLELTTDRLKPWLRLYAAGDFKAKEVTDWEFSSSLQAGVHLGRPADLIDVRLFAFYYAGYSPVAVFQMDWINRFGVGLGIDF